MIAILNYDKIQAGKISDLLNDLGVDNMSTLKETDICKADKVVLPHHFNIKRVIKKFQLLNLYSFLKLIKKPVLGVGNGMVLMSTFIHGPEIPGLGFFDSNSAPIEFTPVDTIPISDIHYGEFNKLEVRNIRFPASFRAPEFTLQENSIVNEASAVIKFMDKKIVALKEQGNYYGTIFNENDEQEFVKELLTLFASV